MNDTSALGFSGCGENLCDEKVGPFPGIFATFGTNNVVGSIDIILCPCIVPGHNHAVGIVWDR